MSIASDLLYEFNAEDDSFLLEIRTELKWDHQKFHTLISLMIGYCEAEVKNESNVNKEIANGFWCCSTFIRDWTSHDNFPRPFLKKYYDQAYEILWALALYFFSIEISHTDLLSIQVSFKKLEALI